MLPAANLYTAGEKETGWRAHVNLDPDFHALGVGVPRLQQHDERVGEDQDVPEILVPVRLDVNIPWRN